MRHCMPNSLDRLCSRDEMRKRPEQHADRRAGIKDATGQCAKEDKIDDESAKADSKNDQDTKAQKGGK